MDRPQPTLLPEGERPSWLTYPQRLVELVNRPGQSLVPWHLLDAAFVNYTMTRDLEPKGLELVPFALKQSDLEMACFQKGEGERVVSVYVDEYPRIEASGLSYSDFVAWLASAEAEAADWRESEEGSRLKYPGVP